MLGIYLKNIHLCNRLAVVVLTLGLAVAPDIASAQQPKVPVPETIPGTTRVDAEGVVDIAGKIPDLVIIDARIAGDRKHGYIENSISLPDEETNCKSLARVIPRKSSPVLFYCNGVKCGRSVVASRIALKCGYTRIYWFRGGYEEWLAKHFPYVQE